LPIAAADTIGDPRSIAAGRRAQGVAAIRSSTLRRTTTWTGMTECLFRVRRAAQSRFPGVELPLDIGLLVDDPERVSVNAKVGASRRPPR
jgi:hypothetical protein